MKRKFIALAVVFSSHALAQTFEVATIHQVVDMTLADSLRGRTSATIDDSLVTLRGQTAVQLIQRAYDVRGEQVVKLPETSRGVFYDVQARIPAGVSKDRVPDMLKALLAERFRLVVHRQDEVRQIYQLTVAPGGPKKLQPSDGPGPGKCPIESGHHVCHAMTMAELSTMITNLGRLAVGVQNSAAAAAVGLNNVATNAISDFLVDRAVLDKTGLDARFEFPFDYGPVAGSQDSPPVRMADSLTALGLRLVPSNSPISTIVIDHLDRLPTEN